ncbi:MAG TPA: EamA family transporter [Steroidobacteraceae bacterium]|nr:EamA family transporter [Steroidobacteraceae bacterium]
MSRSTPPDEPDRTPRMTPARASIDWIAIALCAVIWGTTWHAITLQLAAADPLVSVVYRFCIATVLLFGWSAARAERIALSARQHAAALGMGLCTFAVDYACVYEAETRVVSAAVAVMFGATALINIVVFRLVFAQRSAAGAWLAAALGVLGVALLSFGEVAHAGFDRRALGGLALALLAVLGAVGGNVFARRAEQAGAPIAASTGWAMGYGALLLAIFALATGRRWSIELSGRYLGSLAYLAVFGSVIAFLLYYGVARRRGYTVATYITALTPLIAMLMSSLFEGKRWGGLAVIGVALVVLGQWLLLRTQRASAAASASSRSAVPRSRAPASS